MVSKKIFQQNGRMHQRARGGAVPYKKPMFKTPGGGQPPRSNFNHNQMMFNGSQIPDNPGYMDFSLNPAPPVANNNTNQTANNSNGPPPTTGALPANKKKNNKNKQKNKPPMGPPQQQQQHHNQLQTQVQQNGNWHKNKSAHNQYHHHNTGGGPLPNGRFNGGGMPQRFGFNGMHTIGPIRGRRMMPPIVPGLMGPGVGPRGPPMAMGFHPPMMPPVQPVRRGPLPPALVHQPPLFLRRSARGGHIPPIPPPMPPMMPHGVGMPPIGLPMPPFNGAGKHNHKPNPKLIKKTARGKSTIKTLSNIVSQYPLDKPWVTDAIRAEHATKVDIENRLKGNKDDELFAQFKVQRDKFVAMYENAREEYLKQEAAVVMAKDAKDKQTINKTAAKDGNNKEAIPNTSDA